MKATFDGAESQRDDLVHCLREADRGDDHPTPLAALTDDDLRTEGDLRTDQ